MLCLDGLQRWSEIPNRAIIAYDMWKKKKKVVPNPLRNGD